MLVPMDGFHLFRAQLDAMQGPAHAHARRGAPFTFDGEAFVATVRRIADGEAGVEVPSFEHGRGDPVRGALRVDAYHEVVLVEGIYVLLDTPPWAELQVLRVGGEGLGSQVGGTALKGGVV